MKKFEHKCILIIGGSQKTTNVLNDYGKEGWELVAVCLFWHYLKRNK